MKLVERLRLEQAQSMYASCSNEDLIAFARKPLDPDQSWDDRFVLILAERLAESNQDSVPKEGR